MSAESLPTRSEIEAAATPEARTTGPSGFVPLADGATSEAESLLRLLKDAAHAPAAGPRATFPVIPGYELLDELGRGGMGVVYKARDCNLNRVVALKMVLTSEPLPPGEVERFRAEAKAVAAVEHPNVVRVFELCPADCARPYFSMEYVEAGSLAKLLKERKKLSPREAATLLAPVADGLQAAHEAGIVHRDVKPGNILLGRAEGRGPKGDARPEAGPPPASDSALRPRPPALVPRVSDFGLAKRLASDATVTQGAVRGTPAYMAPEQAGAKSRFVGPQADVYAVGAVLYECLTGSPPFVGLDAWDVVHAVLNEPAKSPRRAEPSVPRDLELICLKCLEKEPRDRYQTAAELADDLRAFLDGRPVAARPISAAARAARWARRHPAQAALAALLAVLVVVVPPLVVFGVERYETKGAEAETAREREKAARAEADLAHLAGEREKDARRAAQKLAGARELFALRERFRTRASERPLGWAAATLTDAARAVPLADDDPAAVVDLRSAAAAALLAPDLAPLDPALVGHTGAVLATDPLTGRVAVGELQSWVLTPLHVWLVDPGTGKATRTLALTAWTVTDAKGGLKDSPDGVRALAFSPDGARLFVGTRSGRVVRFDLAAGDAPAREWKAAPAPVEQLAVSPNGQTVYGLCPLQKHVFAWDAGTGAERARLASADRPVSGFAALPDGLLAADDRELRVWGRDHKFVRGKANPGLGRAVPVPGGLVAGDGPNLDLYDPTELAPTDRFGTRELRRGAHEQNVRHLAVHPSGAFVATASGDQDRTVRVWDLASLRRVGTVLVKGTGPIALAWSGDGRTLCATGSGHVARWAFSAPGAERCACFAPVPLQGAALAGGDRVAAVSAPAGARRELLCGPAGGAAAAVRLTERGGTEVPALAHAPGRPLVVTTPAGGAGRWEPGPSEPAPFLTAAARCPRFAPDGRTVWLIADGSVVRSFDAGTGRPLTAWSNAADKTAHGLPGLDALAVGAAVVATGGSSGSVHLLDPLKDKDQRTDTFPRSGDPVLALALTPDGELILAGGQSGKVRVIRVADRKELVPFVAHPDGVTALAVSRDGSLLATGGRDRTVRLWRRSGERFEPVLAVSDLSGPIRELQFHPDADRLLVLVNQERAARVWDVAHLKGQLGELKLGW